MRSSKLALVAVLGLALAAPTWAGDPDPAPGVAPGEEGAAEASAAEAEEEAEVTQPAATPARAAKRQIALGPAGRDAHGRPGRLHLVEKGDTLWDISDAYLGTPWVWPSIWKDNDEIENPHRIFPGDRIWVTPSEMRRVSAAEAEALLAAGEALPAALGDGLAGDGVGPPTVLVHDIEALGFVTQEALEGASSIVSTPLLRHWLGDHDPVVIGLGRGAVEVGDRFEVFRRGEVVFDPDSGAVFGHVTEQLGWLEVTEVHAESASAEIRMSRSEMRVGDAILPRPTRSPAIELRPAPAIEGRVVHTPRGLRVGTVGLVYLDRGQRDGIEVGNPLEIFETQGEAPDAVRGTVVALPDQVVAKLLVVEAHERTATALVTHTRRELASGDRFRDTHSLAW
jgi:hypothetical protein